MTYETSQITNLEQVSSQISIPLIYRKPNTSKIVNFNPRNNLSIYVLDIGQALAPVAQQITDFYMQWLDSPDSLARSDQSIYVAYHTSGDYSPIPNTDADFSDVPGFIDIMSGPSALSSYLHGQVLWEYLDVLVEHLITNLALSPRNTGNSVLDYQNLIPPHFYHKELFDWAVEKDFVFLTPYDELIYYLDNNPACYPSGCRENIVNDENLVHIRKQFDTRVGEKLEQFTQFVYAIHNDSLLSNLVIFMEHLSSEVNNLFRTLDSPQCPESSDLIYLLSKFPRNGVIDRKSLNYHLYSVSDPMNIYWQMPY